MLDMDGFRIPETPFRAQRTSVLASSHGTAAVDITGIGTKHTNPLQTKPRELECGTRELPPTKATPFPKDRSALNDKKFSRASYFSALTQRFQHHGQEEQIELQPQPRTSGEAVAYANTAASNRLGSQS